MTPSPAPDPPPPLSGRTSGPPGAERLSGLTAERLVGEAPEVTADPVTLAELRLRLLGIGPATMTLPVDAETAAAARSAGWLVVRDLEAAPVAAIQVSPEPAGHTVTGPPTAIDGDPGVFAALQRPPTDLDVEPAVAVVGHDPLDDRALADVDSADGPVLLAVLTGPRVRPGPAPADVVRAAQQAATVLRSRGRQVDVAALPAPEYGDERDAELRATIGAAYRAASVVESYRGERTSLLAALDQPGSLTGMPAASAEAWRTFRPPRNRRGLVIMFTGLSGSGKSTVARALVQALDEEGSRTTTLLDGDVVRRMLSAGLGFSRADRDLNILRIGYVAAEIARHHGTAVCAPIAPFAATRRQVRDMVTAYGDFILVHVATPLEECERRDRKGLYARARAGEIAEFTGISSPYEEPDDADLVVDTSTLSVPAATEQVLELLVAGGWLGNRT